MVQLQEDPRFELIITVEDSDAFRGPSCVGIKSWADLRVFAKFSAEGYRPITSARNSARLARP